MEEGEEEEPWRNGRSRSHRERGGGGAMEKGEEEEPWRKVRRRHG